MFELYISRESRSRSPGTSHPTPAGRPLNGRRFDAAGRRRQRGVRDHWLYSHAVGPSSSERHSADPGIGTLECLRMRRDVGRETTGFHRAQPLPPRTSRKLFDTPVMGHPLTWQITNETPLRRWFETRVPHLDGVHEASTRRLRPVVPRRRPDALPPWLIGMAFDWRLRIGLGVSDDPSATTAYPGWCQVRDVLVGRDPLADAVLASDRMVQDHNPVAVVRRRAAGSRRYRSTARRDAARADCGRARQIRELLSGRRAPRRSAPAARRGSGPSSVAVALSGRGSRRDRAG